MVCHHPDKYCDRKQWDNGEIKFLICHVTSWEHMFKRLREFMGGNPQSHSPPCHV